MVRGVLVYEVVHIAAEGIKRIIDTGERKHAVKQIRTAEEEVCCVHGTHRAAKRHDRHLTPVALARQVVNLRHDFIDDIMKPTLVLLDALTGIAFLVCPGFVINGVDGEHHDFACVDVRTENVVHMEVLEVEEATCLTGDKENRLAAVTVNLEFHIAVQIVRVIFEITNFHERYSFGG